MIYLDNSATTAICDSARTAVIAAMESYGNPSSLHSAGFEAHCAIEASRKEILTALGAKNGRLVFTSCGSEASNLAITGAAEAKSRRFAMRIITTDSEHPSVDNPLRRLEKNGFEIVRIPTVGGIPDEDALERALSEPVFMVSVMAVNNETGAVYDVRNIFDKVRAKYPDVICHCDAVQGFLKIHITPQSLGADLVTVSGHKIHALKGIGALWVSDRIIKEKKITAFLLGGGQEDGYRSGTENTVGIASFGAAAKECLSSLDDDIPKIIRLRDYATARLSELELTLNLPAVRAPHIINLTLPGIKSETMVHFLSQEEIFISAGSACSSHSGKPSRALVSFGLSERQAECSVRISLSRYNTESDIDALTDALGRGIMRLVRINKRS